MIFRKLLYFAIFSIYFVIPSAFGQNITVSENVTIYLPGIGRNFLLLSTSDALDQVQINDNNFVITTSATAGSVIVKSLEGVDMGKAKNSENISLTSCNENGSVLTITATTAAAKTVTITPSDICTATVATTSSSSGSGGESGSSSGGTVGSQSPSPEVQSNSKITTKTQETEAKLETPLNIIQYPKNGTPTFIEINLLKPNIKEIKEVITDLSKTEIKEFKKDLNKLLKQEEDEAKTKYNEAVREIRLSDLSAKEKRKELNEVKKDYRKEIKKLERNQKNILKKITSLEKKKK